MPDKPSPARPPAPPPPQGLAARMAAADLLDAVLIHGMMLDTAAEAPEGPLPRLTPPDRARALRLAAATLRLLARADALLAPHLARPPPLSVRNVLRLAVVEIAGEGAPPHGVVNAAVGILRAEARTARFAGLANAVLRRVAEDPAAAPDRWARMAPPRLPPWLRAPLIAAWTRRTVERIEAVHATEPPVDLTPRDAAAPAVEGAEVLPTGSLRLARPGQVSALPGWAEGAFWVQDAGAALAARLLAPERGEAVLDLCAAPGGKTLQLAAAGAQVTAVDISAPRLARVEENLARCGLQATAVAANLLHWAPPAPVAAILLDAPCSATGTIRRHPDLPHLRGAADVAALADLQAQMIDRALSWLIPGGRLVFCTCSLLPAEGEDQLAAALARHPGLTVERPAIPGVAPAWVTPEGALRLRPDHWADRGGIDGFFMVRLRRPG